MDNYNEIYPQLPESGDSQNPSDFRLQKSCDALNKIEKELKHYECVRKKYNRVRGIFTKAGIGTATLSVILCGSGITTALTGFGVVVGVPLGSIGGLFGLVSVGCAVASKRLSNKVSKHEQTVALAKAKMNTISDLVSKAMNDKNITDREFSLILGEVQKFENLKQSIRRKHRKETEKSMDLSQIRKDVRAKILKELTARAQ